MKRTTRPPCDTTQTKLYKEYNYDTCYNVTCSCIRHKIYYILYRINHVYVEFGNYTFFQFMSVRALTNCLNLR